MKIKRILATLLVACMIFSILPASVLADEPAKMLFDPNVSVDAGGDVTLNLNIENNPGFASLSVRVFYKSLTCARINCYADKDSKPTIYGAATETYKEDIQVNDISAAIDLNKNDTANIPEERAEAGWQMASIGFIFQDKVTSASPRMLCASGTMASLKFSAPDGMETQDVAIEVEILKATDVNNELVEIEGSTGTIHVNGVAPTLGSIYVDSNTTETTIEYGSTASHVLSAVSTSQKDISSLVDFAVKDADGNSVPGITVDNTSRTLSVVNGANKAPAGTYTVTATPKQDAEGNTACTPGDSVTATFTITPATITTANVTINDFGKGKAAKGASASTTTTGMTANTGIAWTEVGAEEGTTVTTFVGGKTYEATVWLTVGKNYKAGFTANDIDVTAKGAVGTITKVLTPLNNGEYKLTLSLTTADKDTPQITPLTTPITATYGQTLADIEEQMKTAMNAVLPEGMAGTFAWKDSSTPVGDVGEGKTFTATFTPNDQANYTNVDVEVLVNVEQKEIDLSSITNDSWNYPAGGFTYDGTVKTVELNIPADLQPYVEASYVGNTATNVPGKAETYKYTATAALSLKDSVNCKLKEGADTTRTLVWTINKGTLTGYKTTYTKEVTFSNVVQKVTITPDLFDLPTYNPQSDNVTTPVVLNDLVTDRELKYDGSIVFELRATTSEDAKNGVSSTHTLTYTYKNYNAVQVTLIIKITDKTKVPLSVSGPASFPYGTTTEEIQKQLKIGNLPTDETLTLNYAYSTKDGTPVSDISAAAPGDYTVTVTAENTANFYTGTWDFTITRRSIIGSVVTFDPSSLTYDNMEHELTMTVTLGGKELTPKKDYTVEFDEATSANKLDENRWNVTAPGEYKFTVTGTGNYTSEVTATFTVGKANIESVNVPAIGPFTYTGAEIKPEPTLTLNGKTLVLGTDYTLSYSNNTNVGTATITITAKAESAHFIGETTKTFEITPVRIDTNSEITVVAIPNQVYNAQPLEPTVTVMFGDRTLVKGTDYTVTYENNTDVSGGTAAKAIITGKGNFTLTKEVTFNIERANLNLPSENPVFTYVYTETGTKTYTLPSDMFLANETNKSFTIESVVCTNNTIFTEAPKASTDKTKLEYTLKGDRTLGKALIQITIVPNSANYKSGLLTVEVEVTDKTDVSNNISFPDGTRTYTGSGIKYEAATLNGNSVSMTYTYAVKNGGELKDGLPLTVGTYTVTATYSDATSFGSKTATFEIKPATPTTPDPVKVDGPGKKLADLEESMRKDIGLAGQFTWTDANGNSLPSTTEIQPDTEYKWTFTPENRNYSEIKGSFVPYVDDISYLPAVIGGNTGSFNFRDVTRTDYYYNAVKWAAENGIASGTSSRTFSPDAVCTRAQTVTFLWRAAGSPLPRYRVNPFTDVSPYDYYYNAVLWAVEEGITTGLTATTFGPDATVTRGQVATFLYRAASAAKPNTFNPFMDVKSSAYNYDAVLWAYDNSITTGTSTTTFSPDAFCTRAQIVTFLYRFYQGR